MLITFYTASKQCQLLGSGQLTISAKKKMKPGLGQENRASDLMFGAGNKRSIQLS